MKFYGSILSGAIRRNPATYYYRHIPPDRATISLAQGIKCKRAISSTGATWGPSQVKGHALWIKGALNEIVGRISGSGSWKNSGKVDQAHAIAEMRAAKAEGDKRLGLDTRGPTLLQAEGKIESVAGKILGCQGMKERGRVKCEISKRRKST